jgi:hypothetical protein
MTAADEMHRRWAGDPEPSCRECAPGLTCVACLTRRGGHVGEPEGEEDDGELELDVVNAQRRHTDLMPGLGRVLVAVQKSQPIRRRRPQ